mgnify:FL=1
MAYAKIQIMLMVLYLTFFVMGAILGSFACCQAYRMRYEEERRKIGKHSECLFCGHRLTWFELIPIISWLIQRGRCRKCKKKIGKIEIISELVMGVIFCGILELLFKQVGLIRPGGLTIGIFDYNLWSSVNFDFVLRIFTNPIVMIRLLILTVSAVFFWILLVYDLKWQRLPSWILYILIGLGLSYFILNELVSLGVIAQSKIWLGLTTRSGYSGVAINQRIEVLRRDLCVLVSSIVILPGLYFVMYKFSKEKLVGGGDYLLTLAMVFFLGRFELALTLLFVANLLALGFNVKQIVHKTRMRVPFGPYLILGFWIILLFAREILQYLYIVSI